MTSTLSAPSWGAHRKPTECLSKNGHVVDTVDHTGQTRAESAKGPKDSSLHR